MKTVGNFRPAGEFRLESGEVLRDFSIVYHIYGKLNKDASNVIWVFHALTANSDVLNWWPGLFGADCLFDPEEYCIVCANVIGSPYGTTAPKNLSFPHFTVRDVAKAHRLLARELRIDKIHVAIGPSFGGSQALEFAQCFDGDIAQLVLIACGSRESAWGIAIHEAQRMALKADPGFGLEGKGRNGLKAARAIGMLTYRTGEAYQKTQTDDGEKTADFKASSYIRYQGEKLADRFTALSYFYLTRCLDSHNLGRGRGGETKALNAIGSPCLVIGITTDALIPVRFQQFLADHIPGGVYEEIYSDYGHDGFLVETEQLTQKIEAFLDRNEQERKSVYKHHNYTL